MVSILPVTLPDVVRVRRRPLEWLRSQGLMGVTAELRFGWEYPIVVVDRVIISQIVAACCCYLLIVLLCAVDISLVFQDSSISCRKFTMTVLKTGQASLQVFHQLQDRNMLSTMRPSVTVFGAGVVSIKRQDRGIRHGTSILLESDLWVPIQALRLWDPGGRCSFVMFFQAFWRINWWPQSNNWSWEGCVPWQCMSRKTNMLLRCYWGVLCEKDKPVCSTAWALLLES